MGLKKKRHHHRLYIPWYTGDDVLYEEEDKEEDSWVNYIRRNIQHPVGEESPFPYSSWSYTRHDSPFEDDVDAQSEKKSDTTIHDEVTEALYQSTHVDASHVKTIVLNGIVCLLGTVNSEYSRREIEKMIREIPGVWSVRNELTIEEAHKRGFFQT